MRMTSALAALTLAVSLTTAACGTDDPAPVVKVSATEHNDADVAFATDMIPHHAQALSMADLTRDRQLDPAVVTLVEDIRSAQAPEIEVMVDWLNDWDEEIPETMRDHVNAGHGDRDSAEQMQGMDDMGAMPGMMSVEDMTELERATDDEFEKMWLTMMIEHHEGAIAMAKAEMTAGQFKDAIELAQAIISSQQQEIDAMKNQLS